MRAEPQAARGAPLFANRSFACLFASQAAVQLGDWFRTIALISIAYRLLPGALSLGGLFLASAIPMLCSSLIRSGRGWSKKRLLLFADALHACLALGLFAGAAAGRLWALYACVAGSALVRGFIGAARGSIVPELLPAAQWKQAGGCFGLLHQAAMLTGSGAAALLIGPLGATGLLLFDAGCAVVSVACLLCVRVASERAEGAAASGSRWRQIREGLHAAWKTPPLAGLFAAQVCRDAAGGYVMILFSLYLMRDLQAGASGVGIGYAVTALGTALGVLAINRTRRKKRAFDLKLYAPYLMLYGIGLGVMYRVHSLLPFLGLLLLACVFLAGVNSMSETALFALAKAEEREGVVAAWLFVSRLTHALSLAAFMLVIEDVPVAWMAVLLIAAALLVQQKTTRS